MFVPISPPSSPPRVGKGELTLEMPTRIGKGQYFISLQGIASIFPVLQRNGQMYTNQQRILATANKAFHECLDVKL